MLIILFIVTILIELTSYMNENQKLKKDLADLVVENDSLIKTITSMNIEHKEQVIL